MQLSHRRALALCTPTVGELLEEHSVLSVDEWMAVGAREGTARWPTEADFGWNGMNGHMPAKPGAGRGVPDLVKDVEEETKGQI